MDKKKKILFIAGIALIVILGIIAILISRKNTENKDIDNLNQNVLKETTVNTSLKVADQSVITREGMSTYMGTLTNVSDETYHIGKFYVVFTVDEDVIKVLTIANHDLKAKDAFPISIDFDRDISKATKVEYVVEE